MRGLLAIEPLYHQIVAGYKTQTRRSGGLELVNGRKATKNKAAIITNPDDWELLYVSKDGSLNHAFKPKVFNRNIEILSPRYKVGEVLYLKEPVIESELGTYYKYGDGIPENAVFIYKDGTKVMCPPIEDKWSNKLFMPASAARAFVRITSIKCERLKEITESDALAEGVELVFFNENKFLGYKDYRTNIVQKKSRTSVWRDAIGSFYSLYMFANKKPYTGDAGLMPNPWLWVYTFEYLPNYQITK